MTQKLYFFLLILCPTSLFSQDMSQGFRYLESGAYQEAETFFEDVLKQYPENKTAKLCYGRAIGLSGDSAKAFIIFTELKDGYPNDFEVKLNYAESLLWDKQYKDAESFYKKLVDEDATSFSAVLGYANTLSNLKKYVEALITIEKALEIKEGNSNALISRKYMRLGYASQLVQNKLFEQALVELDKNLIDFPNDKDTLLNKANIFLMTESYDNAKKVYTQLAISAKDSITSMNGLSLVAHKEYKDKKALQIATATVDRVEEFKKDTTLYVSTKERYIQALLWNQKFAEASSEIEKLKVTYPNEPRIWALSATHGMYTSNFKNSIENYTKILQNSKSSFDGNLGIANAYRATGNELMAYEYAFNTLEYYPRQSDAEVLVKTLKSSHTPFVEQKTAFTFDNGNNEAINVSLVSEIPFSTKFKTKLSYIYRTTKNTITNNEASSNEVALQFSYKFNGYVSAESTAGINTSNAFTTDYTQWTGEFKLHIKPIKLQGISIGYKRELQNFNADLIDREIVMNNYSLNYNLNTNFNLGLFTQYMFTSQTDENKRNLLFTSLYYKFLRRPGIKAGVNYQYIAFNDQVPTIYFSPSQFNVLEVFVDVTSNQKSKWFYAANAAGGYQFIEDNPGTITYRLEGKLGYQVSDRFLATIYSKYSNIASATAAGFEFTEFGVLLKWYFLRKPIFDKKIMELKK